MHRSWRLTSALRILTTNRAPLLRAVAEKIVEAIFEEIAAALHRGDRVELRGFGVFSVTRRKARTGRNPRTGQEVSVASKAFPAFKAGRAVQQRLNCRAWMSAPSSMSASLRKRPNCCSPRND